MIACVDDKKYQELKNYRRTFLESGNIDPHVRPFVAESWKRCQQYDVSESYTVQKLSGGERDRLLKENHAFIKAAHPVMQKLVSLTEGTQYVITLHNREGWILDYLFAGDNPVFSARGFDVGTLWSDATIGTCSSYLSTLHDTEIQLIGHEHYNERMQEMVGTAAPIHGCDGIVIGCINMCGHYSNGNIHTLGLVKMAALLIESTAAYTRLSHVARDTFDILPEGIVVLDESFRVQQVTLQAAAVLKMSQKAVRSLDFRRLFPKEDFSAPFSYPEYELSLPDGHQLTCNVQVTPVFSESHLRETVIIFRESRRVNRYTSRMSGNRASYHFEDIITQDDRMLAQIDMMRDIADTDCCVLIEGESGTGKELFAHSLHNESSRRNGPFIAVNCASLPRSLVESELFGYEKGAFTGARSEGSPGKFELADGGSIFLDEVGELPLEIQATLLRVLDNHKVIRIGGRTEKNLDVRVIAATNRNLYQEVQNGNFRSDLFFRINVLQFDIPPLRERGADIPLLAHTFLDQINEKGDSRRKELSLQFLDRIARYQWPGNVRELQNTVVRAYYACKGTVITDDELPGNIKDAAFINPAAREERAVRSAPDFTGILADAEKQAVTDALKSSGGDVTKAGELLGISKATVYRRMKKYGISLR